VELNPLATKKLGGTIFGSGAPPYFEYPQDFAEKMLAFMAQGQTALASTAMCSK